MKTFGHAGYLVFYTISGLATAIARTAAMLYTPLTSSIIGTAIPLELTVGVLEASGAISGVLGAYLVLFPKAQIITTVLYMIVPVPAISVLGFWFVMQRHLGFVDVTGAELLILRIQAVSSQEQFWPSLLD